MPTYVESMETLSPSRLAWRRALEDPSLKDLPYKIETNEYGQLVMSPTKLGHSMYASLIAELLAEHMNPRGHVAFEISVDTPKGVKVPDVAWLSEARWRGLEPDADATEIAPEICIEVLSHSNTRAEIDEKRDLYFNRGAEEFWTCDSKGRMRFFSPSGEMTASRRAPDFPSAVGVGT